MGGSPESLKPDHESQQAEEPLGHEVEHEQIHPPELPEDLPLPPPVPEPLRRVLNGGTWFTRNEHGEAINWLRARVDWERQFAKWHSFHKGNPDSPVKDPQQSHETPPSDESSDSSNKSPSSE